MTWVATGATLGTAALGAAQQDDDEDNAARLRRDQEAAELDRQNRISTNIGLINSAFDRPGRKREIGNFMQALRSYYGDDVARQKRTAARGLKFALARAGQTGGSLDIDQHRTLGEEFEDAALAAEGRVQEEGANLQAADERERANLIAQARGGMGLTTSLRRAQSSLESNLGAATTAARGQSLGDLFTATTDTIRNQAERRERRRGFGYTAGRADLYGSK